MRLLLIETSAKLCSAAISENGSILAARVSDSGRSHASLTAVFVRELLDETGLRMADIDGVAVSFGPGSYTGLRVGVSTAKGLCFGSDIPLIGVGTLDVLVAGAIASAGSGPDLRAIVPVLDARRMEVYTAIYSPEGIRESEVRPEIVTPDSFSALLSEGKVLLTGDAVAKCREVITSENAVFLEADPVASAMLVPAEKAYKEKRFEDTAYFEPFYLKEFVATVSRKNLFQQA